MLVDRLLLTGNQASIIASIGVRTVSISSVELLRYVCTVCKRIRLLDPSIVLPQLGHMYYTGKVCAAYDRVHAVLHLVLWIEPSGHSRMTQSNGKSCGRKLVTFIRFVKIMIRGVHACHYSPKSKRGFWRGSTSSRYPTSRPL